LAVAQQAIERVRHVYYGWLIVAAGMAMQTLQSAVLHNSFGAYIVLLQQDFGWSRTAFSIAFSIQQGQSGILGPVQGWMIDRWGPRAVMRTGIILFGIGFMLMSRIESLAAFYVVFLIMAIGNSLGGFLSLTTAMVNWFHRRRATVLGLVSSGQSLGGFLVPLVALSLVTYGWRTTAFISGIAVIVLGLLFAQPVRRSPEQYGYLPDGDTAPPRPAETGGTAIREPAPGRGQIDFTPGEALRTSAFWLVAFGHAAALLVVSAVMVYLVPYLTESLGYSVTSGAVIVTLFTIVSAIGQMGGGFLGDRISKRLIVIVCMFGHVLGLLMLAYATALWMVIAFAVLHGAAWGFRGPLMQAIRADYFGRAHFATILGFSSLIWMLGMMGGPIVVGIMADNTGSYRLAFTLLALLAGVGTIFWVLARPPKPPKRLLSA
jgi:MFS family permease